MADLFLSYGRSDLERARALARALEEAGWSVWWDHKIPPGSTWRQFIKRKLDESSCIITLWSTESVQSRWVALEASYGLARGILVPALIEDVEPPWDFTDIQAANLIGWDGDRSYEGFADLRRGIAEIVSAAAASDPAEEGRKGGSSVLAEPASGDAPLPGQMPRGRKRQRVRVTITYDVEVRGALTKIELPFVIGVMADLAGDAADDLPDLSRRGFVDLTLHNLDRVIEQIGPVLRYTVADRLGADPECHIALELTFSCLEDFSPDAIAERVEPVRELIERKGAVADLARKISTNPVLARELQNAVQGALAGAPPEVAEVVEAGEFKTEESRERGAEAIQFLVDALMNEKLEFSSDTEEMLSELIHRLDERLSALVNEIIGAPKFRKLESSWRGLRYLLSQTEAGGHRLKIRVMHITRDELSKDLTAGKAEMGVERSQLYQRIHGSVFGQFGSAPYGLLLSDFAFDRTGKDVKLLTRISQLAAAAHAPFIAGAAPEMFGFDSFRELAQVSTLEGLFEGAEYAMWRAFRDSEDARYVALTLPRMAIREPYGRDGLPVHSFDLEETVGESQKGYLWASAAWGLGSRIAKAFERYGWCARIHGVTTGGRVEGLPSVTFRTSQGSFMSRCPTEVLTPDDQEFELRKLGFVPLANEARTLNAVFFSVPSTHRGREYEADGVAGAFYQLPRVLAVSRFAHYLKVIMRDSVGRLGTRRELNDRLEAWIGNYVLKTETAREDSKARRPLSSAHLLVMEDPRRPGRHLVQAYLHPYFQLPAVDSSIRVVLEVPGPLDPDPSEQAEG